MVDFIANNGVILTIFLIFIIGFAFYGLIYPHIRRNRQSTETLETTDFGTKLEKKVKEVDFLEIKEFDDDEYVREVFNSVFYSVQCDDWSKDISYDKIKFSKKKQTDRYNSKSVTIEFDYRFDSDKDYKKRIFTIKDVKLIDGSYISFYFKGVLPIEVKKFLYDIYSEWINERNSKEKEKVDKSLENIKDVLGKASERGAKLDELLGS